MPSLIEAVVVGQKDLARGGESQTLSRLLSQIVGVTAFEKSDAAAEALSYGGIAWIVAGKDGAFELQVLK